MIEYMYTGGPDGCRIVWANEASDFPDDPQEARVAEQIVRSMDASSRWERCEPWEPQQTLRPYSDDGSEEPQASAAQPQDATQPTQADVRAWAQEQGIEVNAMGRVPKSVIDQYLEAHEG